MMRTLRYLLSWFCLALGLSLVGDVGRAQAQWSLTRTHKATAQVKSHCGCYATPDFCTCTPRRCKCYGGLDCHTRPNAATADTPITATLTTTRTFGPGTFGGAFAGIEATIPVPLPPGVWTATLVPAGQRAKKAASPLALSDLSLSKAVAGTIYVGLGEDGSVLTITGGTAKGDHPLDGSAPLAYGSSLVLKHAVSGREVYPITNYGTLVLVGPIDAGTYLLDGTPRAGGHDATIYRDPQTGRRWRYTTPAGEWDWLPEQSMIQPPLEIYPSPVMGPGRTSNVFFGGGFRMMRGGSC